MSAPQQPGYNAPVQGKSRVIAGLLNLFLGGFGIGDFYLGYTQYAIYKIVISLVIVVPTLLDLGFISTIFSLLYYAWAVVLLVVAIMTFLGKWIYEKAATGVPPVCVVSGRWGGGLTPPFGGGPGLRRAPALLLYPLGSLRD